MNILLIGCGKTGGAIVKNLMGLPQIKNIYLLSKFFKGAKLLEKSLHNSKIKAIHSLDNINSIDYTIIALSGIPKKEREKSFRMYTTTHEMRQHELRFNFESIKSIGKMLKPHSKKIKFVVVTNPSEEITNYLQNVLGHRNVFGFGTELDAKRYSKILGREVLCLGSHGRAFPLINANSKEVYDSLLKQSDSEVIRHLKEKGIQHDLVGLAFRTFFEKLSGKRNIVHICSYLKKSFLGVKNISISLPFEVENGNVIKPAKIKVNKIEKEKFQELAKDLKKSVDKLIKNN